MYYPPDSILNPRPKYPWEHQLLQPPPDNYDKPTRCPFCGADRKKTKKGEHNAAI
jgi:hypothetical protein